MPRFPFSWGATVPPVTVPPPPPPFWTTLTAGALSWQGVRAGLSPRFEHIFPQQSGAEQQFRKLPPPD